ncbi:hypothetical protein B0H17DRAFT_1335874 [Mycena rosella]|uniref:Uncharacterized protein n=1 Tax=Mycena rosella TaxID=1033263 RepID=A0AAD7G5M7_MYCRO|nr:hypothetical protein B0H17DRAFT_1335874 [Mycena rosella]
MSANAAWSMSAPCLCGQPWSNHEMLEDSAPVQPPMTEPNLSLPPPVTTLLQASIPNPITVFTGPSCSAAATANDNRNAAIARHFPKPKYCPPHAYPANTAKEETFQAQVLLWPNVGLYEPLGSAVPDFVYTIDEFTEMMVALKAHGLSFIAVLPSGESSNLVDKLSSQLTAHIASHNLVLPRMPESLGPVTDPVPWFRRPFMVLQASRRKAIYTFAQHASANGNNFNRKFILDTNSKFTNPDVEHSGLPLIVLAPRFGHVQGPLPPMLSPDALYASMDATASWNVMLTCAPTMSHHLPLQRLLVGHAIVNAPQRPWLPRALDLVFVPDPCYLLVWHHHQLEDVSTQEDTLLNSRLLTDWMLKGIH